MISLYCERYQQAVHSHTHIQTHKMAIKTVIIGSYASEIKSTKYENMKAI